jgi:hypothetical protein
MARTKTADLESELAGTGMTHEEIEHCLRLASIPWAEVERCIDEQTRRGESVTTEGLLMKLTENGRPRPTRNGTRRRNHDDAIVVRPRIYTVARLLLKPAWINNQIYKPVDLADPAIVAMAQDIGQKGILEPLVVTLDNVVVSGHRRLAAAEVAGLSMVPVRRLNINSWDDRFPEYLVSFNNQRVKSPIEQIREEVIRTSPDDAHNALLAQQKIQAAKAFRRVDASGLRILGQKVAARRSAISHAKRPMLEAATAVIMQYQDYWPLTLRQIHYRILTRNVLRNSNKPGSLYVNNEQSYKDLSDLLTRARLIGEVPWESMHDPTRPRTQWEQWENVGFYMREQVGGFLSGYKRNLIQSQAAYVELVVEKITAQEIGERAAGPLHVPVGVGRGYTSATCLKETADRFHASGKDAFIMLIAGDLDPEGEDIPQAWTACLRDEHGIENLTAVKVAVNPDQIEAYNLAPCPLKGDSSRAAAFQAVHGDNVYELEAFEPDVLQRIIRDAITSVLDMKLFAQEQRKEAEEARLLIATQRRVQEMLKGMDLTAG